MRAFDLLQPRTLAEATALAAEHGTDALFLSGGAMLSILLRERLIGPRYLISLVDLPELGGVRVDGSDLVIGATVTLSEIARSAEIADRVPVLAEAARMVGNVRVRNVATVGGHLAQADPHLDLPPVLLALGASVETQRSGEKRRFPVDGFFTGYYESALEVGEIVVSLRIPSQPPGLHGVYLRYCSLSAEDWPTLGVAAFLEVRAGEVAAARVAVGGVGERAFRLPSAEAVLAGRPTRSALADAGRQYAAASDPIGDAHGSADYKRQMTEVFVRRAIAAAAARAGLGIEGD